MQFRYRPTRAHGGAGRATRRTACAPAFQLLVRHGRTLTVDGLCVDDDVATLEAASAAKTGVPAEAVWLSHAGKRLAAGLRALSERRNLAAAGHIEKLIQEHPHSMVTVLLP